MSSNQDTQAPAVSRIDRIATNMKFAVISQIVLILVNFAVRKVFIMTLGEEYLGLSGLFTDILAMLSLAELGFGSSMIFSLYKPLAQGDTEKIRSLMKLFEKAYRIIGIIVLVTGLALTPFLDFFVKEMPENIDNVELIYVLNVINAAASYFYIYKASLLFADQKKYVEMRTSVAVKTLFALLEIAALLLTGNYIVYLVLMITSVFVQNLLVSVQADRIYPFLKEKEAAPLPKEDLSVIRRNVGANFFHKVGSVVVYGTDSILMAKFVSVAVVGLYSNYMLIRKALITVCDMVFLSMAASMGNLNACETDEKKYQAYNRIFFFAAWMFGFMAICLWNLYNPFITLWLGSAYLLDDPVVLVIVLNFYTYCMRMPVTNVKEAMGLFWNDRYKPLIEAVVNLVVSILLAQSLGILGVLLGTLISTLTVPFVIEPYVLFKHGLHQPVGRFYLKYAATFLVTVVAGALTMAVCNLCPDGFGGFVLKMVICAVVPNAVYFLVYRNSEEFRFVVDALRRVAGKYLHRVPGGEQ